jgi:mRNA interferase YafQ
MKSLRLTTQYKKDIKKYRNKPVKIQKLIEVLSILVNEETFPKEFKPHKLSGNYKNHVECHIEGDLLLIWLDEENDTIGLIRFGTHSELFDK